MAAVVPVAIAAVGSAIGGSTLATTAIGTALGFAGAAAATAGTVAVSLATAGLQFGASLLFAPDAPKAPVAKNTVRIPSGADSRFVLIGETKVTGDRIWWDKDTDLNHLYQLSVLSWGPSVEIVQHYLDGEPVEIDGEGWVTSPSKWAGNVQIVVRQGNHASIMGQITAAFPYWASTSVGRGLTLAMIRQKPVGASALRKTYPQLILTHSALVRGVRMPEYDGSSEGWTNNAARAVLWHLTDEDAGLRVPFSRIDSASFAAHGDVCDQAVALKSGGAEARYAADGFVDLAVERRETLRRLLQNCDADLRLGADGRLQLVPYYQSSGYTIGDRGVLSYQLQNRRDRAARVNAVAAIYSDAALAWREVSTRPRELPGSDGETRNVATIQLPFCKSGARAQRLAKRHLWRLNPVLTGEITTDLRTVQVPACSAMTLSLTDALTDQPARIASREIAPDIGVVKHTVECLDPRYEEWDEDQDEFDLQTLPVLNGVDEFVSVPQNVSAQSIEWTLAAGRKAPRIEVTFDPVDGSLDVEVQHSEAGQDEWEGGRTRQGNTGLIRTDFLEDGVTYDVRVRFIGSDGLSATEWVVVESVGAVANETAPSDATIDATDGVGIGTISATITAPGEAGYFRTLVKYAQVTGSETFAAATSWGHVLTGQPGGSTTIGITGLTASTSYRVWAQALNESGVGSATPPSDTATAGSP